MAVSVVVPIFNERECLDRLFEMLIDLAVQFEPEFTFEFLLVDDGSTDGTHEMLIERAAGCEKFRVVQHPENRGIAAAIHTGIVEASHEVIASIDADGSYDPLLIGAMAPLLTEEIAMVTASPYHPEGSVEGAAAWRIWLSKGASRMYRLATGCKLHCSTSCFRIYRREAVLRLLPENGGYVGVAELMWKVHQSGGEVIEHPAVLRVRTAGQSKMKVFRAARGHLRLMGRIVSQRMRRKQGKL